MTVDDERALLFARRSGIRAATGWRTQGVLMQIVLFVLTALGVMVFRLFLDQMNVEPKNVIVAILAIGLAEFLIRVRRWSFTGVEAALWAFALYGFLVDVPYHDESEVFPLYALATALAGFRTRNPVLGGLAAFFVVLWCETRDLGVIAALVIGLLASVALLREWRRPSTEGLWIVLAAAMPLAGTYVADPIWRNVTICLYAIYGVIVLALAIGRMPHHALFAGGGSALAVAAVDLSRVLQSIALEAKLAIGGIVLLGGSWLLARALRDRTRGIVVTPETFTELEDALELAATAGIPQASFQPAREGGGKFGGAGATGGY